MWANWEVAAFIDWLKGYNIDLPADKRLGFYGLYEYSFRESMNSIIKYLEKNDLQALAIAKIAMKCFEPYAKTKDKPMPEPLPMFRNYVKKKSCICLPK